MFRKIIETEVRRVQAQLTTEITQKFTFSELTNKLEELTMLQLLPKAIKDKAIAAYINEKNNVNVWGAAIVLGEYINTLTPESFPNPEFYTHVKTEINDIITAIRNSMGVSAKYKSVSLNTSDHGQTVVEFGTSGWRGKIGDDFTVYNVHKVTRAIIDMMHTDEFLKENGYKSFQEVQKHGLAVFRDNRFMGEEFIQAAIKELTDAGIKVYYAGECATGIGSKLVKQLKAAGSINFTPSHNPMDAAGLKFNPADGGPAGPNLTNIIQAKANEYMGDNNFTPANGTFINNVIKVDAVRRYVNYLKKSPLFKLDELRQQLLANTDNIALVIDNMHGASRGVVQAILGKEVMQKLDITFVNTNDDHSFHGAKPEPSTKNHKPLIKLLEKSDKKIRVAVSFDPDADRIHFGDVNGDLDMNMFAGIAFNQLLKEKDFLAWVEKTFPGKQNQGVITTIASSRLAEDIAAAFGRSTDEVDVGFKNFREALVQGLALMGYEESDGFTVLGHTLEKDGFAAFLIALKIMLTEQTNLSNVYAAVFKQYGKFYDAKDGIELKGVSISEWQVLRKAALKELSTKISVGQKITIGDSAFTVKNIDTRFGALKIVFEDNTSLLFRSSGTETKFRYYVRSNTQNGEAAVQACLNTANQLLSGSIAAVEESKKAATANVTAAAEKQEDKRAREGEIVGDKGNKAQA